MAISVSDRLRWYKREDVQRELVRRAEDAEIAVLYSKSGFGKRPDVLLRLRDVLSFAQQGATSFHCSEELWRDPMQLSTSLKRRELDELRIGWDLVLDIDCPVLEYSQIASDLLIQALRYHGIKSVTAKFSGNHGFHLAVPFQAFPESVHGTPTRALFPEGPRKIAAYLRGMIRAVLAKELLKFEPLAVIARKIKKSPAELAPDGTFNPFTVLEIDTILIASRHLYRMCYSFNEKSGLLSIPVDVRKIREFQKSSATPDKAVVGDHPFLVREGVKRGEATKLIVQAFDEEAEKKQAEQFKEIGLSMRTPTRHFDDVVSKIPEQCFPPCVRGHIAKGLEDGKKRAVFIMINFLQSTGWQPEDIEAWLHEWNKRNPEPLRENELTGPLRYHKNKKVLPPNCSNEAYYTALGLCHPDGLCKKIKNPVNYAIIRQKMLHETEQQGKRKTKSKEQDTKKP